MVFAGIDVVIAFVVVVAAAAATARRKPTTPSTTTPPAQQREKEEEPAEEDECLPGEDMEDLSEKEGESGTFKDHCYALHSINPQSLHVLAQLGRKSRPNKDSEDQQQSHCKGRKHARSFAKRGCKVGFGGFVTFVH